MVESMKSARNEIGVDAQGNFLRPDRKLARKVAEESEEFLQAKEELKDKNVPAGFNPHIFGSMIAQEKDPQLTTFFLKRLAQDLQSDKNKKEKSGRLASALESMVIGALADPVVAGNVKEIYGQKINADVVMKEMERGQLKPEIFEAIVGHHVNNEKEKEKAVKEVMEKFVPEYKKRFKEFAGQYHVAISDSLLDKRLSSNRLLMEDDVTAARYNNTSEAYEAYHEHVSDVLVIKEEALKSGNGSHYIAHELTHSVAGLTLVSGVASEGDEQLNIAKEGLAYNKVEQGKNKSAGVWLNEAVTESIAIELGFLPEGEVSLSYQKERYLFNQLLNSGSLKLDKGLFYKTYFENYAVGQKKGVPIFNELTRLINQAYGPNFFNKLNSIVEKGGVEAGIKLLESGGWLEIVARPANDVIDGEDALTSKAA